MITSVDIPSELLALVSKFKERNKISNSDVIRIALVRFFENDAELD